MYHNKLHFIKENPWKLTLEFVCPTSANPMSYLWKKKIRENLDSLESHLILASNANIIKSERKKIQFFF